MSLFLLLFTAVCAWFLTKINISVRKIFLCYRISTSISFCSVLRSCLMLIFCGHFVSQSQQPPLLDKASVPRGNGAVLCMRPNLSSINSENYIVLIWMIWRRRIAVCLLLRILLRLHDMVRQEQAVKCSWRNGENKGQSFAREFIVALSFEVSSERQIAEAEEFAKALVDDSMCVDICIHDTGEDNPHAHIMATVRPLNLDGTWQKTENFIHAVSLWE